MARALQAAAEPRTQPARPAGGAPLPDAHHARQLRRSLISLAVLALLVVVLLLAVPGLGEVTERLEDATLAPIAAAVVLELLSCWSFVVVFGLVFDRGPRPQIARLAWSELAANAVLPAGGAGGLGLGAWVLRSRGVPAVRIAERTAVMFLITSAVNVGAVLVIGVALGLGALDGTSNPLLSWLPAGAALAALVATVAIGVYGRGLKGRGSGRRARIANGIAVLCDGIIATLGLLRGRDLRVLGAVGYMAFDVAVLAVCFSAFGSVPPIGVILMAYLIGMLGGALPIPGGIGAVEGGLIGVLVLYGVDAGAATAAVLIYRAIALWIPALLGTIAFSQLRRTLNTSVVHSDTCLDDDCPEPPAPDALPSVRLPAQRAASSA